MPKGDSFTSREIKLHTLKFHTLKFFHAMTTTFNMDEYITHNVTYNTIICCQHKQGIPPQWIARHFREFHKTIPLSTRQGIVNHCKTLNLLAPEDVAIPTEPVQPIHGLSVLDGFQCEYEGCSELRSTELSIKKHCRDEHQWVLEFGIKWAAQPIQTLFASQYRK
jgi:hypothetical protein